eukprot:5457723-Prymnesium_polylepis.2
MWPTLTAATRSQALHWKLLLRAAAPLRGLALHSTRTFAQAAPPQAAHCAAPALLASAFASLRCTASQHH